MHPPRSFIAAPLAALLAVASAAAQLPTATGRAIPMANPVYTLFIPSTYQHRPNDVTDLLIHFKGDPQGVWNNAKYANLNTAIVTINYDGFSTVYTNPFLNTSLFQSIMDEALTKVRALADFSDTLQWGKVGVSSFSAGFGSVREILKSAAYRNRIDALLMADSLYAGLQNGTANDAQMADFKTFAGLAKSGAKSFILDHSQEPVDYASTTVCADEILAYLGLAATPVDVAGLGSLHFYRHAQSRGFELWGETANTADEHPRHLEYIGQFLKDMPLAKLTNYAADFNRDGSVDATDFSLWQTSFASSAGGDADLDGDADGADFLLWQQQSGRQPAVAVVPEPFGDILAAAALVTMAAMAYLQASPRCV